MTHNPNYRQGEWEGAPCDTLNAQQPGDGFVSNPYHPSAFPPDTTYRLCTPVPDKTQSPDIYFRKKVGVETGSPANLHYLPEALLREDRAYGSDIHPNKQ